MAKKATGKPATHSGIVTTEEVLTGRPPTLTTEDRQRLVDEVAYAVLPSSHRRVSDSAGLGVLTKTDVEAIVDVLHHRVGMWQFAAGVATGVIVTGIAVIMVDLFR